MTTHNGRGDANEQVNGDTGAHHVETAENNYPQLFAWLDGSTEDISTADRNESKSPGDPTRRDVLKVTGSTALATSLAGCPGGDSGDDSVTEGTTTSPSDAGSTEEPERYAINPPEMLEDATPLERAVFTDMHGERAETPGAGIDAPSYLVSYGHDAGGEQSASPAQLAAGVVSTPAGDGENALASMPFEELLVADEGAPFRRAIGLAEDPAFVQEPLHLETEAGTALEQETETEAFLVALEGQNFWAWGGNRQISDSGIGVATVYTMRVTVGGTAVLLGMVDGMGLPTGRTPAPGRVDPEDLQRVAELLGQLQKMALMWKAVSALGRMGCSPEDEPPPPERQQDEVVLESQSVGLTADGQKALGYPTEETSSLSTTAIYTINRTDHELCSDWDEESFAPGTRYQWDIETRMRTYTVGGDDTFPVGVITSPNVQQHGAERNPLVTESLRNLLSYETPGDGHLLPAMQELELYDEDPAVGWKDEPLENALADRSGKQVLGDDAEVTAFNGTIEQLFAGGGPDKELELHVARATTDNGVVIALMADLTSDKEYWNERSTATEVFDWALDRLAFDPATPSPWEDISVSQIRPVQRVTDTEVVDGGNVLHSEDDPDLIANANVTPLVNLDGPSEHVLRTVLETTTASRSEVTVTEVPRTPLENLLEDALSPGIVFHRLANHISEQTTDPPVFELATGDSSISVTARAPSGYVFDTTTVQDGDEYNVATLPPLKAGFITLVDPQDGDRYGNDRGWPRNPVRSWRSGTRYLAEVYPGPLVSYMHTSHVLHGGDAQSGGLFKNPCTGSCVVYKDMQQVTSWVNAEVLNSSFPNDGRLEIYGLGGTRQLDYSDGFDVIMAIVPGVATQNSGADNYYTFWNMSASGLAFSDPAAATSSQGAAPASRDEFMSTTVAQEIGHYFQENYLGPSPDQPMAQRRFDSEDQRMVNGKRIDPAHARHRNSDLRDRDTDGDGTNEVNNPPDDPGVVSTGYWLANGFSVIDNFEIRDGSFTPKGPGANATELPDLPSYMSYSNKSAQMWADARIQQQLIDSGWNPSGTSGGSGSGYKLSATGGVTDDGEVRYDDVWTRPGPDTLTDMEDADVEVELLGPDGTTVLQRVRVPRTVRGSHGDGGLVGPAVDVPSFTLPFDDRGVTVRTTLEGQAAAMNPIVRCVGDAVRRVPEDAFTGDRAEALSTIDNALDEVATAMDRGAYGDAASAMDGTVRTRIDSALGAYEKQALNVPSRGELSALVDEMVRRLEGLSDDDPDSEADIPTSRDRWDVLTGNWEFQDDQILQMRSATGNVILARDIGLQDGTFAAEMNSVDGKKGAQLIWRGDGDFRSNYHRFGPLTLNDNPRLHWDLIQDGGFPGNIEIEPMSELPVDVGPDEFHDYRIEFEGTTHRMYVDDQLIFKGTDDRLTEYDRIGFHVGHTTAIRNVRFSR